MQEPLLPNLHRAQLAIWMIWTSLGINALNYVFDFSGKLMVKLTANGFSVPAGLQAANTSALTILGMADFMVTILAGIAFMMWFRRGYYNLSLRTDTLSSADSAVITAWIFPIISLFRPYQLMREMYNETALLIDKAIPNFPHRPYGWLLGGWWTFWIGSGIVASLTMVIFMQELNQSGTMLLQLTALIQSIMNLAAGILAVRVITEYAGLESLLANVQAPREPQSGFDEV